MAPTRTYQLFLVDETNKNRNDLIRQIGTDARLMGDAVSIKTLKYPKYTQTPLLPNQNTANTNYCAGADKGLILAPAERVDLIVDFQCVPGQKLRWVNASAAPFDGWYAAVDAAGGAPQPIDPTAPPATIQAMGARLPFPEVMRFDVAAGSSGTPLQLPSPLAKSFQRWTHQSPELKGHAHRWLALNEKLKGTDFQEGYLFFNELIALENEDPRKEDFTITLANENKTYRFLNRPVFFRSPINFYPQADKPEVWHIINFSADSHPVHLHLVDFQILSRYSYVVADPGGGFPNLSIVSAMNADGLLVPDPMSGPHVIVPNPNAFDANFNGVDANEVGWKDTVRVNRTKS